MALDEHEVSLTSSNAINNMPIFGSDLKREIKKTPVIDRQDDKVTPRLNRQSSLQNRLDVQRVSFSSSRVNGNQQFETPENTEPRRIRPKDGEADKSLTHRDASILSPVIQEKEETKEGENESNAAKSDNEGKLICDLGAMNRFLVSREHESGTQDGKKKGHSKSELWCYNRPEEKTDKNKRDENYRVGTKTALQ